MVPVTQLGRLCEFATGPDIDTVGGENELNDTLRGCEEILFPPPEIESLCNCVGSGTARVEELSSKINNGRNA